MAPQVVQESGSWEEEIPASSRKTVAVKLVLVASVVAVATFGLYSVAGPAQVLSAVNEELTVPGDELERPSTDNEKGDCVCLGKCSAKVGDDGLHRCAVGKTKCIGIDYKTPKLAKGVTKDSDCVGADGKANGKCNAVCEFVQGRYDCWNFPCLNGGWCSDQVNGYKCHCAVGYEGDNCEKNINECKLPKDGYPCHERAECFDSQGAYECKCKQGWEGDGYIVKFKDTDPKTKVAHPTWLNRKKKGAPNAGCTDIDDCQSKPCLHGGICTNTIADKYQLHSFVCDCPKTHLGKEGWTGKRCEEPVDECVGGVKNPLNDCDSEAVCQNNDLMVEGRSATSPGTIKVESFTCECGENWTPFDKAKKTDPKTKKVTGPFDHAGHDNAAWLDTSKLVGGGSRGCYDKDDCASHPCKNGGTCYEGPPGCKIKGRCDGKTAGSKLACEKAGGKWLTGPDDWTPKPCFTCKCAHGWSGFTCEKDEDECSTNPKTLSSGGVYNTPVNDCNEHATCTNLLGSYACSCNLGWTGTAVSDAKGKGDKEMQQGCWDANDCVHNPCAHGGTCTDCGTLCTFCECVPGWRGVTCATDWNECLMGIHRCNNDATCINTPGSYTCKCDVGFTGDGIGLGFEFVDTKYTVNGVEKTKTEIRGCHDIDDCKHDPSYKLWPERKKETSTVQAKICEARDATKADDVAACKAVKALSKEEKCKANDKCAFKGHLCDAKDTKNNDDRMVCQKITKTTLVVECNANDKCKVTQPPPVISMVDEGQGPCIHGECHTGRGPLAYRCKCKRGWQDTNCDMDINECMDENTCHRFADCTNTEGGYECKCKPGYVGNGKNCLDEDDCKGQCMHGFCTDLGVKDFRCTCDEGWEDKLCDSDINECAAFTHGCGDNTVCTNRLALVIAGPGEKKRLGEAMWKKTQKGTVDGKGYSCACKSGFDGAPYKPGNCKDINDCNVKTMADGSVGGQACKNGVCEDTGPNSYKCHCAKGWEDFNCDYDVNECYLGTHHCVKEARCVNIPGSYTCRCLSGYGGDGFKEGKNPLIKIRAEKCKAAKADVPRQCKEEVAEIKKQKAKEGKVKATSKEAWRNNGKFNEAAELAKCTKKKMEELSTGICKKNWGQRMTRTKAGKGGLGGIAGKDNKAQEISKAWGCHDLDDCNPEPCYTKRGKCVDRGPNKYECVCDEGWGCNPDPKFKTCKTNCNECESGFGYPAKNRCAKPQGSLAMGGVSTCTKISAPKYGYSCQCNHPQTSNGKGYYGSGSECSDCTICKPGYKPVKDPKQGGKECVSLDRQCENINECTIKESTPWTPGTSPHNCDDKARANCIDTVGSFKCECKQDGVVTKNWLGIGRGNEWHGVGTEGTCRRCTRCYPGFYEEKPCTSTSDRVCKPYIPSGLYMVESEADDNTECLRLNPDQWFPTRFDAGNGNGWCGLKGGKKAVLADATLVWRFTQLDGNTQLWSSNGEKRENEEPPEPKRISDLYTIESQAEGEWKCLFFGNDGNDLYPSLQNCKSGAANCPWTMGFNKKWCGLASRQELLDNRQAVWKVTPIKYSEKKFIIQNRKRDKGESKSAWECMLFEKNGAATNPSRYNWGNGETLCGAGNWEGLGVEMALLGNKQAVYIITAL